MKRWISFLLTLSLLLGVSACGTAESSKVSETEEEKKIQIGLTFDSFVIERWQRDRDVFVSVAKELGAEVNVQNANGDVEEQKKQIDYFIQKDMDVIVIIAIDPQELRESVAKAKDAGIKVVAYDRLIMNSDAVSYYATFDNYMVGTKQGEYIRDHLDLDNADGPFNIELTTGDPGDNNARFFFGGAMDVLQPYIDSGKLVVKSGQTEFEAVATANWSTETAQARMDSIVSANYADGTQLHACLCSNDSTALGVANSLEANYTGEWPIITGQDCDIASVKNMIAGKQSMSIFKDTRTLASKVVEMVDAIMKGGDAPVNDTKSYDNGTGIIPSYLCEPVFADINNYKELLIDSGYYTEADLQ